MASPKLCAVEDCGKPAAMKVMKTKRRTRSIWKLSPTDVMKLGAGKYGDGGGLWLMKDRKDAGRWAFRYRFDHSGGEKKDHELGIGSIHTFSLSEARDKAKALRKLLKEGIDPLADRKAAKARHKIEAAAATTFQDFAEEYITAAAPKWSNPKSEGQWRQSLTAYAFPIIGALPIAAVDTEAVKRVLLQPIGDATFWASKAETASRVRSRIEKILDAAKVSGKRNGAENPARWKGHLEHLFPSRGEVEKGRDNHHPAMPFGELPGFLAALRARESSIAALALEWTILTVSRVGAARLAVWKDEIDLHNKVWTIPAHRMKTRQKHEVPLTPRMIEILEAVKSESPYIFPGRGAPISDKSIREAMTGIVTGYTVHGFRSTFKDWCSECTEYEDMVSEMALAHRTGSKVKEAYLRTRLLDRRRQLMNDWCSYCSGATGSVLKFSIVG